MPKLTERDSDVIRWLLREADARDAREPRPHSIDTVIWVIAIIAITLAVIAAGAFWKAF